MAYKRNPRRRVVRGSSSDELRRGGRRTSEEFDPDADEMDFVRLGSSSIGTAQDVVQRIGNAIIGGDFGGNARGSKSLDIQVDRTNAFGTAIPTDVVSGDESVGIGNDLEISGDNSVGFGSGRISGDFSVGIGAFAVDSGRSIVFGTDCGIGINADESVAIGDQSEIGDGATDSVLIGSFSFLDNPSGVLIGHNANLNHLANSGVGLGDAAQIQFARAVGIGKGARPTQADEVALVGLTLKLQTSQGSYTSGSPDTPIVAATYESVITTADAAPVTGNLIQWADVDRVEDAGVAVAGLATAGHTHSGAVDVSGTPVAGRVASWVDANTVQDAGFAASDVARLSQANVFAAAQTIDNSAGAGVALTVQGVAGQDIARILTAAGGTAVVVNADGILQTLGVVSRYSHIASAAENATFSHTISFSGLGRPIVHCRFGYVSSRDVVGAKLWMEGVAHFSTGGGYFVETISTSKTAAEVGTISISISGNVVTFSKTAGASGGGGEIMILVDGKMRL